MKLAFLILAHKHPKQLQALCDKLLENDCEIFLHIDQKGHYLFDDFIKKNEGRKNFHIYSKYKVYWGSFLQIKATFFLLENAVRAGKFDFISLISGQDAPVKPLAGFKNFLSEHRQNSFMHWHKLPAHGIWAQNGGLERVNYFWLNSFPKKFDFITSRVVRWLHAAQRKLNWYKKFDMQLYGGTNWFTLNAEMANYVIQYLKSNPSFFRKFRLTHCADEIILQTILMNSPYSDKIINSTLRHIDWNTGPEYPRMLRMEDYERMVSGPDFFARKFDDTIDGQVLEKIYKNI